MNEARLRNLIKALNEADLMTTSAAQLAHCATPCNMLSIYAYRPDLQQAFFNDSDGFVCCAKTEESVCGLSKEVAEHFGLGIYDLIELFDQHGCGNTGSISGTVKYLEGFIESKKRPRYASPIEQAVIDYVEGGDHA